MKFVMEKSGEISGKPTNTPFIIPRPPLWSRSNVVVFHPADPGLIPGQVNFLVEERQLSINLGHIHPSNDGDGL